jgi:hypothetical protein
MKRANIPLFYARLAERTPEPKTELESVNDYTLLVAVVLSAQATDAGVNIATRGLFACVDTPQAMLELGEERFARANQDNWSVQHQGEECDRALTGVVEQPRRSGAGRSRRAGGAARRRAQRPPMW